MSEDSSKDVWSEQFYKALEAVGNLTEQERNRLGEMLVSLSSIKNTSVSRSPLPDRNAEPLPLRQLGKMDFEK